MSYTSTDHQLQDLDDPHPDQVTVASGAGFETVCAASGLVIAVIGMLGNQPARMAALATIVMGFGVFARAGTIAARSRHPPTATNWWGSAATSSPASPASRSGCSSS